MTTPEQPKRRGRPPAAPTEQTKPRSVRLNDARWAKLKQLGSEWLERAIDLESNEAKALQ